MLIDPDHGHAVEAALIADQARPPSLKSPTLNCMRQEMPLNRVPLKGTGLLSLAGDGVEQRAARTRGTTKSASRQPWERRDAPVLPDGSGQASEKAGQPRETDVNALKRSFLASQAGWRGRHRVPEP